MENTVADDLVGFLSRDPGVAAEAGAAIAAGGELLAEVGRLMAAATECKTPADRSAILARIDALQGRLPDLVARHERLKLMTRKEGPTDG